MGKDILEEIPGVVEAARHKKMEETIGKKIKIVRPGHPHQGYKGTVERVELTAFGIVGMLIRLDKPRYGIDSCFVFELNGIDMI